MAQTARHFPALTLNTDGKAHPVENTFALATIILGMIASVSAIWDSMHLLSSWTGLIGIFTGLYGQMISATTAERFVLIIGLGASAVGFYLGMAHGGLFGGLW